MACEYRIAVDAMGGDQAPPSAVNGALLASASKPGVGIYLVGSRAAIAPLLAESCPDNIEIIDCAQAVAMDESPLNAVKRKPFASINVCMHMLASGKVDAAVSAGNSGATVASAAIHVKRLRSVSRPALLSTIRLFKDRSLVLLDVGANVECSAKNLLQFAKMGLVYAQTALGIDDPKISLLNNGSEDYKGTEEVRSAHEKLMRLSSYQGFAEGFDLFSGKSDVIVCSGFIGNVVLKTVEGLLDTLTQLAPGEDSGAQKLLSSQPSTAAVLVGVRKPVYVCHGNADKHAIANAILQAYNESELALPEKLDKLAGNPIRGLLRRYKLKT